MSKFFIYLEKVLQNVKFFNNNDILDEIGNNESTAVKNKKVKEIRERRMNEGDVYYYKLNDNPFFNFKIGNIIYELLFITSYDQNALKIGNKLMAMNNKVDPKVAGRYGVAFYPTNLAGVKYDNVKLSPDDSTKLFDYLRTCAEKVNQKKFYFDGANTKKENEILKKVKKFKDLMSKNSHLKNKVELSEEFDKCLKESLINLNDDTLKKIKETINKIKETINKENNFEEILTEIIFLMRDALKLNKNARERYFIRLLKKEGIQAEEGEKYTRTIFFELP
jgi:hypothetical protein